MTRISIVVPTRNRLKYLPDAVSSILRQENADIECIVIDGASSDGTREYLHTLRSRIRWLSEPDKGHVDAIMKGWRMSHGDYLAWLNDDDLYTGTDAIASLARYLDDHADIDVAYGDYTYIDESGASIGQPQRSGEWNIETAAKRCTNIIPQAASLIRRSALESVGWLDYDFEYCKDHELWLRIGLQGKLRRVPIQVAGVRICPGISNHGYLTADGKVRLTEKFFSSPALPTALSGKATRRRAISIANLKGASVIFQNERDWVRICKFVGRAFMSDPLYTVRRFSRKLFGIQWA